MNLISPLDHELDPQIWSHLLTTIFKPLSTNKGTGESEEKREKLEKKEKGEESEEKKRPLVIKKLIFVFALLL